MRAAEYLSKSIEVCRQIDANRVEAAASLIFTAYLDGGLILTAGNGGSQTMAAHLANDLTKLCILPGAARIPAIALTNDTATMTAWANDESFECAITELSKPFLDAQSALVLISSSGDSPNIVLAAKHARLVGAKVIGIGRPGSALQSLANVYIETPGVHNPETEDGQAMACHALAVTVRGMITDEINRDYSAG